jgi:eukaryotic-like serine/threonine-protein kinase
MEAPAPHPPCNSTTSTSSPESGILPGMSSAMRYRLVRKIAHGGMAEIFLAQQMGAEGFKKPVVLKRILPTLAADSKFVRMLIDEAHIASTLNHSNLVQVLDLGKSGDQYFLVLEFVDGWSLEQVRLRAEKAKLKLPLPLILYVVGTLCRALAYVHGRTTADGKPLDIIHRDVTPQNVLISREGDVKLADFGIAKASGMGEKSATGIIKGKFAYMSPEQSVGSELDARSDLFSVGTLLYVLTTGRKPFGGTTDLDVLMQVRKARYEKPSTFVKDFNEDVERFIARALRSERSKRWQTAEQMANRIEVILGKLGQPSGPGPLKRWLDTLSARDGVRPPAEVAPAANDTIEIASSDLELEDVSPPDDDGDPGKTRQGSSGRARVAQRSRQPSKREEADDIPIFTASSVAPASGHPVAAERAVGPRPRRRPLRALLVFVVVMGVLGGGVFVARPYLPSWIRERIDAIIPAVKGVLR